jgi:hypothetical protein
MSRTNWLVTVLALLAISSGARTAQATPQGQQPLQESNLPPESSQDSSGAAARGQQTQPSSQPNRESPELAHIIDSFIQRENQLIKALQNYSPRMEIYIQKVRPDPELGAVPDGDYYFLGQVRLQRNRAVVVRSFLKGAGPGSGMLKDVSSPVSHYFSLQFSPTTFYFSLTMDNARFDRQHYDFEPVRQEFLGDLRCLVFDVKPKHRGRGGFLSHRGDVGLFEGRIWVEDHNYNIVRFNGTFTPAPANSVYYHFDSWRENVQPGLWLPVYAYSEETGLKYGFDRTLRFRAQIRFWGYGLQSPNRQSEMTRIEVDSPSVRDSSESGGDPSPVASERAWQEQAQDNVLDRLQQAGLLAPPGEVEKVLETVVNNLIVTNHLVNLPAVHCRLLLTSTIESLAVGNTIVLSRGLIDVLPDEPSLAAMLAHELAHIVLQQTLNIDSTRWAFEDRLMVRDEDLLRHLSFRPSERDEEAADAKAIEMLKNSPYRDQLGKAGLFLRAMANVAPRTPELFGAHLGNRLVAGDHVRRMAALMSGAPPLERTKVDQIAALPLGARVTVDPWNDEARMLKAKPVALVSAREKMPFEVTPLFPYLTRLPAEQAHQ